MTSMPAAEPVDAVERRAVRPVVVYRNGTLEMPDLARLEEAKQGNSYTENNFTANIDHYHADSDGSDDDSYKSARRINGTLGEGVKRDYVSKETLEDSR